MLYIKELVIKTSPYDMNPENIIIMKIFFFHSKKDIDCCP